MTTSTPPGQPSDELLQNIDRAAARLHETVDALPEDGWRDDTILPGWTRAHVLAHLALNAESLTGVLEGLRDGVPATMYSSDTSRDEDIDALAGADPATVRKRLAAGTASVAAALRDLPAEAWHGTFSRLPGGPAVPAGALPGMRHREVEIHHADLGAGYGHRDWPAGFVVGLLDTMAVDHASAGPFRITATDLGRSWEIGAGGGEGGGERGGERGPGPEVTGTGADLGWWLVGREISADLSCDAGDLPSVGPWRRSPLRPD